MKQTIWWMAALACLAVATALPAGAQLRESTPPERTLDRQAFQDVERLLAERLTDIQSVVVLQRGRVLYEFYRDGSPATLRDVQSVQKSALSILVGVALQQGKLVLDQPVLALIPEWTALNSDPRAASITVRHLLTLTAGFAFDDPAGITGGRTPPAQAWARPLRWAPGERFGYDNALIPMLVAVLERAVGTPAADFARLNLMAPLGLAEPSYQRGLAVRTIDMATLGQLMLQDGLWDGKQVIPGAYAQAATQAQSAGGPPVGMPYGYMWWIVPSDGQRKLFLASGYSGQSIWVDRGQALVIAMTSTVSEESQRRGHAVALLRGGLVAAAQQRARDEAR